MRKTGRPYLHLREPSLSHRIRRRRQRRRRALVLEPLEQRTLLATLTLFNLGSVVSAGGGDVLVDGHQISFDMNEQGQQIVVRFDPDDEDHQPIRTAGISILNVTNTNGGVDLGGVTQAAFPDLARTKIEAAGNIRGSEVDDQIFKFATVGSVSIRPGPGTDQIGSLERRVVNAFILASEGDDTFFTGGGDITIVWSDNDGSDTFHIRDAGFGGGVGGDFTFTATAGGALSLSLSGDPVGMLTHRFSSSSSGEFFFGNTIVQYSGATSFTDATTAGSKTVFFSDNSETITASSAGASQLQISGAVPLTLKAPDEFLTIRGGDGNDMITVDSLPSSFMGELNLRGDQGHDTLDVSMLTSGVRIMGNEGNDTLLGGQGDDLFEGGTGDDRIVIQNDWGRDQIIDAGGVAGERNTLDFSLVTIDLEVELGNQEITVLPLGAEEGGQEAAHEIVDFGPSANVILGGQGNDKFLVGDNDLLLGGNGAVDGGGGLNELDFSEWIQPITVDLAADSPSAGAAFTSTEEGEVRVFGFTNISNVTGGQGNDTLLGNQETNELSGGPGNDTIDGRAGDDVLSGGADDDLYLVSDVDQLGAEIDWGIDQISDIGGANDKLQFDGSLNILWTIGGGSMTDGRNRVDFSESEIENLRGGAGRDIFVFLDGAAVGGDVDGFLGVDTLDYSAYSSDVQVLLQTGTDTDGNRQFIEGQATGAGGIVDIENAIGGSGDDFLVGSQADNVLDGGPGDDNYEIRDFDSETAAFAWGEDVISDPGGIDTLSMNVHVGLVFSLAIGFVADAFDNRVTFSLGEIDSFRGGAEDDTFQFGEGTHVSGMLDGSGGSDTLSYLTFATSVSVDLDTGIMIEGENETVIGAATGVGDFITRIENAIGGTGNDRLMGDDGDNTLVGGPGDDEIYGRRGNDHLQGDDGGDDYFFDDGWGEDTIVEEAISGGRDRAIFMDVDANLVFNIGLAPPGTNPAVLGLVVRDEVGGLAGNGVIHEGDAIEDLIGGQGHDEFFFADQRVLAGGFGTIDGQGGFNSLSYEDYMTSVRVNLQSGRATGLTPENAIIAVKNIQSASGGGGNDHLIGDDKDNLLTGGGGADILEPGGGVDQLIGGLGPDTFKFRDNWGMSTVFEAPETQFSDGDTLDFSAVTSPLSVAIHLAGVDVLSSPNTVDADIEIERIIGGQNDDDFAFANLAQLANGPGPANAGIINGGGGVNTISYAAYTEPVFVEMDRDEGFAATGLLDFVNIQRIAGGRAGDELNGDGNDNTFFGLGGADLIRGRGGNDVIIGGDGDDALVGGDGINIVSPPPNNSSAVNELERSQLRAGNGQLLGIEGEEESNAVGGDGNDRIFGGAGSDQMFGEEGDDELFGEGGNDTLNGGPGIDLLRGGEGLNKLIDDEPTWQNPDDPLNVDGEPEIVPNDVLFVINFLLFEGPQELPRPVAGVDPPPPYVDVNGDGFAAPDDAIILINFFLVAGPPPAAEGELVVSARLDDRSLPAAPITRRTDDDTESLALRDALFAQGDGLQHDSPLSQRWDRDRWRWFDRSAFARNDESFRSLGTEDSSLDAIFDDEFAQPWRP